MTEAIDLYRCPGCMGRLLPGSDCLECSGCMVSYPLIEHRIPDLTYPLRLSAETQTQRDYFDSLAPSYDAGLSELLQTGEAALRRVLVDRMDLRDNALVLEIGVATGNNLRYLLDTPQQARLVGLDLSRGMVRQCWTKAEQWPGRVMLCVANGEHLPFKDQIFDAVLHFGFINEYLDRRRGLAEVMRVLKDSGTAVVADDGIVPSAHRFSWAQELMSRNRSFAAAPPIEDLPPGTTVCDLEWFSGLFYILTLRRRRSPAPPLRATQRQADGEVW